MIIRDFFVRKIPESDTSENFEINLRILFEYQIKTYRMVRDEFVGKHKNHKYFCHPVFVVWAFFLYPYSEKYAKHSLISRIREIEIISIWTSSDDS